MRFERLCQNGFTLLETMIAIAIMAVAFASILMTQSNSINASVKSRQISVVAMLARNIMVDTEYKIEGKAFDEIKKEESDHFPEPFQEYQWKRKIRELKFPNLSMGNAQKKEGDSSSSGSTDQITDTITKLLTNFLSKAVREIDVTITWKKGTGEQSYSISTYWVDLNHEFTLSE